MNMRSETRSWPAAATLFMVVFSACGSGSVTTTTGAPVDASSDSAEQAVALDSSPTPLDGNPTDPETSPTQPPETTIVDAPPDTADFVDNPACIPDPSLVIEPLTGEDRRFENVEAFLTGYRLEDFEEGSAPANADANWGGIWGDFKGGIVVAVLDCTLVDLDEVARLAGPSGTLRIIEVPYTFAETERFKNDLYQALLSLEIPGDVRVDSTLIGREITVNVPDPQELPEGFAPKVPTDAYNIGSDVFIDILSD